MSQDLLPQHAGAPLLNPPIPVPTPHPPLGPDTVGPLIPSGGVQEVYQDVPGSIGGVQYTPPAPGSQIGEYRESAISVSYYEDLGLREVPVAGPPGTPAQIVRVHSGKFYKRVAFLIQRVISLPVLPSSSISNPNETLISRYVSPAVPGDLPDGNQVWTVQGEYWYALRFGPSETDILTAGISPLAQLNGFTTPAGNLPPSVWNQNLISPSVPPAAASGLAPITF